MKFFKIDSNSTIDSLKKEYKRLAFIHHPDRGGSVEMMQMLNNEYEAALNELGKQNNKNYSLDQDYMDLIDKLIKLNMQGVTIEICGWFVYIAGDTKPYKKELKAMGLYWHSKKVSWYYKPSWYVKKGKSQWDMEKIRNTFGSQVVNNNNSNSTKNDFVLA